MQTVDARPATVNWDFAEGDTVRLPFTFYTDETCTTLYDTTGLTYGAKLTDCKGLSVDGTIQTVGESSIVVRFHGGVKPDLTAGDYHYTVTITNAAGDVQTIVEGFIYVERPSCGSCCHE